VVVLGASSVRAQTPPPSDVDSNAAEQHWQAWLAHPSLHTQESLSDGAKGGIYPVPHEYENPNIRVPPQFKDKNEWRAYLTYCRVDAMVVGKALNSTAVLMSTKSAIYTVSHFEVSQVIKNDGSLSPGKTVVAYRLGGEVVDKGERLRIETPDSPPYKAGETYLLELTQEKGAGKPQYSTPDFGTISVRSGRVYSNLGDWAGFPTGTPYTEVAETFSDVASMGCK
jgi:hypothetical protein